MLQFIFALFKTKHASSAVPGRIRKHHLATYRKPILLPNTPGRNTRGRSILQELLEPEHDATEPWCCRATFEHQNHSISQAGSTLAMVGKSPISHHGLPCRLLSGMVLRALLYMLIHSFSMFSFTIWIFRYLRHLHTQYASSLYSHQL